MADAISLVIEQVVGHRRSPLHGGVMDWPNGPGWTMRLSVDEGQGVVAAAACPKHNLKQAAGRMIYQPNVSAADSNDLILRLRNAKPPGQ